jgi:membrane protein involved in colicin uptake
MLASGLLVLKAATEQRYYARRCWRLIHLTAPEPAAVSAAGSDGDGQEARDRGQEKQAAADHAAAEARREADKAAEQAAREKMAKQKAAVEQAAKLKAAAEQAAKEKLPGEEQAGADSELEAETAARAAVVVNVMPDLAPLCAAGNEAWQYKDSSGQLHGPHRLSEIETW